LVSFDLVRLRATGAFFSAALGAGAATTSAFTASTLGPAFLRTGAFFAGVSSVDVFAFALGLDVFFSGERAAMVEVSSIMKIN